MQNMQRICWYKASHTYMHCIVIYKKWIFKSWLFLKMEFYSWLQNKQYHEKKKKKKVLCFYIVLHTIALEKTAFKHSTETGNEGVRIKPSNLVMLSTERLRRTSTEKCKGQTTQDKAHKAHNAVRSFSKLSCCDFIVSKTNCTAASHWSRIQKAILHHHN